MKLPTTGALALALACASGCIQDTDYAEASFELGGADGGYPGDDAGTVGDAGAANAGDAADGDAGDGGAGDDAENANNNAACEIVRIETFLDINAANFLVQHADSGWRVKVEAAKTGKQNQTWTYPFKNTKNTVLFATQTSVWQNNQFGAFVSAVDNTPARLFAFTIAGTTVTQTVDDGKPIENPVALDLCKELF